jgi:hypothetical protein
MQERIDALPNAFYDAIVFVIPGIQLIIILVIGLGVTGPLITWVQSFNWTAVNVLAIIGGVAIVGYEYGRIVETWSSFIVQKPLVFLAKKRLFIRNTDFNADMKDEVDFLDLEVPKSFRKGSKWTIYNFALLISPRIGTDLLKRYAWEKLARSSAFTYGTSFLISLTIYLLIQANILFKSPVPWVYGSLEFTIVFGVLTFVTYYEYYQRNCWNNDLLSKTIPILKMAGELRKSEVDNDYLIGLAIKDDRLALYLESLTKGEKNNLFSKLIDKFLGE